MADTSKRNSVAGKPQQGNGDIVAALSKAVGSRVRIQTHTPRLPALEGVLYTVSATAKVIALAQPAGARASDYRVLPLHSVKGFSILGPAEGEQQQQQRGAVDMKALKAREVAAVARLKQREEMRKKGVGSEAIELFEALGKTLPVRWQDLAMVVNDSVLVSAPYRPEDCRAPKDQQHKIDYVKRVLENERRKLQQKTGKGQNADATAQRKGG